jgi:hypothetical protein
VELQRRAGEEEKEISKKLKALEKQRKDRGKEDMKKTKEEKKVNDLKVKEESKKNQLMDKEKLKALEKKKKEEMKKEEKVKQQLRKDILTEIRKFRNDAQSAVLSFFDNEEEDIEENSTLNGSTKASELNKSIFGSPTAPVSQTKKLLNYSNVTEFLDATQKVLSFPNEEINRRGEDESKMEIAERASQQDPKFLQGLSWDDVFYIANSLNIIKPMLGLGRGVNLDELLASFELGSEGDSEKISDSSRFKLVDEMEVVAENAGGKDEAEAEFPFGEEKKRSSVMEKSFVELEKIELFITKALLTEVHSVFDFDQKELIEKKAVTNSALIKFPLNQLTWLELSRMALLSYLFAQLERPKEDTQHALRGSKQPNYRIAKNIIRNIRYRWYLRNKLSSAKSKNGSAAADQNGQKRMIDDHPEDRLFLLHQIVEAKQSGHNLQFQSGAKVFPDVKELNFQRKTARPLSNYFNNENEIEDEISKMATDESNPEIYRRCAKVLLKLLSLTSVKNNFLWEIDQEAYPDYYSLMIRPLMFANVATSLISKSYDTPLAGHAGLSNPEATESENATFTRIGKEFYEDLRQIVLNCISFSTELPVVVGQAQKLFLIFHRYCSQWIFSPSRPSIERCNNEFYCLLTQEPIHYHAHSYNNNRSEIIKCGKCTGVYSMIALEEHFLTHVSASKELEAFSDFFVPPTTEIINSVNEEWHCPLCLREDSHHVTTNSAPFASFIHSSDNYANPQDKYFYVDEWGPSNFLPWTLNANYSNTVQNIIEKQPYLVPILDALYILSDPIYEEDILLSQQQQSFSIMKYPKWNYPQKIKILYALCLTLNNYNGQTVTHLNHLHSECEKLLKLCSKTNFREGDFISIVRNICGEDSAFYCRNLLDGILGEHNDSTSKEGLLQSMITEGRCILCNGSTYEDDMDEGEEQENGKKKNNKVILCDGCNAEVHLRCLNLSNVSDLSIPSWFS